VGLEQQYASTVLLSREGLEGKLGKGRAVAVGRCGGTVTLLAHMGTE